MDWSKEVKNLTPEEIKERREFLTQTLQVKEDYEDFIWETTLEVLKKSNKYFVLSEAMEKARGNRNFGIGNVEYALSNFTIEIPDDEEIYNDISKACDNFNDPDQWSYDGRVFRDCNYNYDVIYSYYVSSDFKLKLNFVLEMYNRECKEHGRKVNEGDEVEPEPYTCDCGNCEYCNN